PPTPTPLPYTTLFRSASAAHRPLHLPKTRLDLYRPVSAGGPRLELLMIARHRLRILQHVSREHRDHAVARPDHALADQPLGPGEGRGARRLAPNPRGVHDCLGLENLIIAHS